MSEPASISTGIAVRYATAIFELAKSDNKIDALEADVDTLDSALNESTDFTALVQSPLYSRAVQQGAVTTLAAKMGLTPLMKNTLALMASKRRLFVLPQLVHVLREMVADEKGIVTADVATATALTAAQTDKLAETLKAQIGKDVKINATVDESLIGGLVVKVGSRMIDLSVAAKLANLQHAMKEVG